MKKIKLDANRLHLKKIKIADLTEKESTAIQGGTAPSTTMPCPYLSKNSFCKCFPSPVTLLECHTGSLFWECAL
jgi:hypothetical protein